MKGTDRGQFGHDDADDLGGSVGAMLDAYLDGQLSGAQLSAFEARLARDPALVGARDAQRRIDGGLRGLFVVPPFIPLPMPMNGHPTGSNGSPTGTNGHPVTPTGPTTGTAGHGWAGVKSAILSTKGLVSGLALLAVLLAGGGWLAYMHFTASRQLTFAEIYAQQVRVAPNGTVDGSQVETVASQAIGYGIRLKDRPANLKLISMSQANVLSPHTFVLQARYQGQDVVLLADRSCEDKPAPGAHSCGMNQFRREVGGVVFYELSALDQPTLLNVLEVLPAGSVQTVQTSTSTTQRGATTRPAHPKP